MKQKKSRNCTNYRIAVNWVSMVFNYDAHNTFRSWWNNNALRAVKQMNSVSDW